jgi:hypothetical protein
MQLVVMPRTKRLRMAQQGIRNKRRDFISYSGK